ncbi:hypothetical protein CPIN18021_0298 [Campylobacter pinnipediorum subsp. caledonicus]|uniref:Scaffolding protein n=1 Tax=Campylobacter pinnipediorum subsp. caledonicus TaxID=1874362 RepID=A0A1S6U644_9BACT|nr:hypothetical protein [Campylobacter pinnipediorum]AQW85560.1 hypothetical protein CPIN18020_0319 [Campylobacter pinnipediorum subsp. caledonicus]AQW87145.1 hypothetical protein CPIN18021_0298 [Campylobacter pinnipediorum subsp. caledonicus]
MTENEALASLVNELVGDSEVQETQEQGQEAQEQGQESKEETKQEAQEQKGLNPDDIKNALAQALNEQEAQEQQAQEQSQQQAEPTPAELERETLLKELGLSDYNQKMQELQAFKAQQEQMMEQARKQELFNQNINMFEKEFPTIKPEDLGKFAEENGVIDLLGEDYKGWKIVAKAMLNTATPKETPDDIIGTNGATAKSDTFERIKRGESVSNVDIGEELLRGL